METLEFKMNHLARQIVQESDNTDTWSREEVLNLLGRKSIHKWSKDRSREDMDAQSGS